MKNILTLFICTLFSVFCYSQNSTKYLRKGIYNITTVYNLEDKSTTTFDPEERMGSMTITVTPQEISIIQKQIYYTPEFDENNNVTMKPIEKTDLNVKYTIKSIHRANAKDGTEADMCACMTEENKECNVYIFPCGHNGKGEDVYAFKFVDGIFDNILYCFTLSDIKQ